MADGRAQTQTKWDDNKLSKSTRNDQWNSNWWSDEH